MARDTDPSLQGQLEATGITTEHGVPTFAIPMVVAETSGLDNGPFDRNPVTSPTSRIIIERLGTCATPLNLEKEEDRKIVFETYVNRAEIAVRGGWEIPIIIIDGLTCATGFANQKEKQSKGFGLWVDHYWANTNLSKEARLGLKNVLSLMMDELSKCSNHLLTQATRIEIDPWDVIGFAFWLKKIGKIDGQTATSLVETMETGRFLPADHNLSVFSFIAHECSSASGRIIASDHIDPKCYEHFLLRYFLETDTEGNLTSDATDIVNQIKHSGHYYYEISRYAVSSSNQIGGFRAMKSALKKLQNFSRDGVSSFMESTPRILNSMQFFDQIYKIGVTHGIRVGVSGKNNSSKLN